MFAPSSRANTAKDQVQALTCARTAVRKAIGQETAEDQEMEPSMEFKVLMAGDRVKGKGAAKKSDAIFSKCGKYDHKSESCLARTRNARK